MSLGHDLFNCLHIFFPSSSVERWIRDAIPKTYDKPFCYNGFEKGRHFLPCGGHRGWFFRQEVSQVYVFGCFELNKGFNGRHVGSCSPSILMREPFVFSKSAHGASDVTSSEVKVYKPPVLRSRVGCRDTVALIVCVSIAGQSTTTQAQQLPQLQ